MTDRPLTEKQRRFVEAYCGPAMGNATAAARTAGYANPEANAHAIMENHGVRMAIEAVSSKVRGSAIATIQEIHETWSECLRTEKADWKDRLKAGELLAKCRGEFAPDKHEVDLGGSVVIRYPRRPTETT